ncbi:MAG: carboxypeptidase regulatory-like domain-containing protein [Elusimicrobiota bacterium]|nr:carboxypeptidase regulatory-like domain-containing protein [Elusimicrobiota bacterium]
MIPKNKILRALIVGLTVQSLFLTNHAFAGTVLITKTAVTDSAGASRTFFSSSERINLRIESYCTAAFSPDRIYYRFYIKNPAGAQVFYHDSNSTEGNAGSGAAALRNIPMSFYSGPGLYRFKAELVVGGVVRATDESKSFTVFSPVITLTYPPDRVTDLMDKPVTFRWVASGASKYRVSVADERSFYNPLWTLETPASYAQYPLNPDEDRQRLSGGTEYYWKAEGVSSDGSKVASSDIYSFTLKKEALSVSYRNLVVSSLEYDPMSTPPEKVIIKAGISNMGNQSETAVKLNLFVGGILSGFTQINSLMPAEKTVVDFEIASVREENIIVTIMIPGADENAKDNVLTKSFSVNLPEEWRNVPKILGRVLEAGTENGIPGIRLKLEGPASREIITGAGGQYKFANLIKGQYKISVLSEGIKGDAVSVNVTEEKAYPGNKISVTAVSGELPEREEQANSVVKGRVTDADKGDLAKVLVKLMRKTSGGEYREEGNVKTSAKGFYKLMNIRGGVYNIIFEKEGFETEIKEIEVEKGVIVIRDCALKAAAVPVSSKESDYTPVEAWQIIREKIKDKDVLGTLEGYKVSDISVNSGSVKETVGAIKEGELKIKSAEVEIIR